MTADITQASAPTTHEGILSWVAEVAELTQPDRIHWCTGSEEEWTELTDFLVSTGTFTRLNPEKKPNSFHAAPQTSRASRTAPSSAASTRRTPGPPTTGWTRTR
jgi:phosphoenolpyruvate carboxykinase (GTP)